jgi:hypothetical protein
MRAICEKKKLKNLVNQKKKRDVIFPLMFFHAFFFLVEKYFDRCFDNLIKFFDMCFDNLIKFYASHHYYIAQAI